MNIGRHVEAFYLAVRSYPKDSSHLFLELALSVMRYFRFVVLWTFCSLLAFAQTTNAQTRSTYDVIQQEIFDTSCVSCHRAGTSFATQSDLVLTADVSYESLIDVPPQNRAALADNLVRVDSRGGLPAPHLSFLWEKVNVVDQVHFYQDHPSYGALMPLGLPPLTNGQLQLLRTWLEEGAPREGVVADEALLEDTSRFEDPPFRPLDVPDNGIQFHVGPFDVWPSELHDREFLYYEPYETTEDLYLTGYEISMEEGSHHFIVYHYPEDVLATPEPGVYRDVRDPSGAPDFDTLIELGFLFPFRFFVGTQTPYIRFQMPEGIALRLPPGKGFDLNSHSVNRSDGVRPGEVYVNLYLAEPEDIRYVATPDNFNNQDLFIPAGQEVTISEEFTFSERRHLIQIWAHAHESMQEFSIYGVGGEHDGELLYWTNDWEHPPLLFLDPPLTMEAGDQVRLETRYRNDSDVDKQFGLLSTDEMQFMFYMYYTDDSVPTVPTSEREIGLNPAYPNPFAGSVTIPFRVDRSAQVQLTIYDVMGREIARLVDQALPSGNHDVVWNPGTAAPGVYYVRLRKGTQIETRKIAFVR